MSLRNRSEAAKNIKPRENKSNFFQREKNKISEVIPSLLLVTDDIISPINVVFDATNKLFSGETFNEKNSLDKNFLEVDKVCNSLPTKTFNCSEMSNVESFCDPSEEERQEENYPEQISDELKFDKVLIRSTPIINKLVYVRLPFLWFSFSDTTAETLLFKSIKSELCARIQ